MVELEVAFLTHVLRVAHQVGMLAICGHASPTLGVIACVAHSLGVVRQVHMGTVRNLHRLSRSFKFLSSWSTFSLS